MKTIEERAKEYADIHKATEFNYFGVGQVYGYERIYNAEITAYERGAKEQKAIDDEMRLKKCDDMTEAEYNRETSFVDWYLKNGKGTPTYSDAIEWARKDLLDKACKWLKENARDYACAIVRCPYGEEEEIICDVYLEIVEDFRKAMEE